MHSGALRPQTKGREVNEFIGHVAMMLFLALAIAITSGFIMVILTLIKELWEDLRK